MVKSDEHRDRLIDLLLREHFRAEEPPDLVDRILAHARPPRKLCPPRWHRRALAVAAVAAAAAVLLIVASVITVAPKSSAVISKPSTVSPDSSTVVSKTPRPAASDRLSARQPLRAAMTAARRPLISATVRVPGNNVRPFRVPEGIPIPAGRVRIPSFSIRLPQSVSPFTTTKKRSPS